MKELTTDEIVEVNGEKWIIAKRYKTDVPLQVKLLDIPLQIIERYRPMQKDNLLFPDLNYRTVCKQLKKMIKECGSNKNINFHSAGRLRLMAKCRPLRVYLRNAGGGVNGRNRFRAADLPIVECASPPSNNDRFFAPYRHRESLACYLAEPPSNPASSRRIVSPRP